MLDPAAFVANRIVEREAWARERLAAHAGRTFVVRVGPFASALGIEADGRLATRSLAGLAPDVTLTLSPLALPSFLANPARWNELVTATGDAALAAALADLAQTLPWFVERAFAAALGPVLGQRAADAGRHLLAFPEHAALRVGESVASFARDETALVAGAGHLRTFAEDAAALAARVDALAARLDAVATRLDAAAGPAGRRGADVVPLPH